MLGQLLKGLHLCQHVQEVPDMAVADEVSGEGFNTIQDLD